MVRDHGAWSFHPRVLVWQLLVVLDPLGFPLHALVLDPYWQDLPEKPRPFLTA
jgi:hypothetical protein